MSDSNPILFSSAQSIEAYQQAIEQSTQAVMQWLKQPEMYQGKTVAELRDRIKLDFTPKGLGNEAAIERAVEFFLKDSLSVHHPQCVAHLHCPSLVVSQAAEVLINATNQSMDSWDQSPSATIIEIKLIEWLRTRVGYQAGDAGVFTSGGTGGPRLILVGSALIPEKATRDTVGINMVTLKKNARIAKVRLAAGLELKDPHRYRVRTLPAAGALLRQEDTTEQMSL